MNTYEVVVPYIAWVTCEVRADDEDIAINEAIEKTALEPFDGNGGTDKLIGVVDQECSVSADEVWIEEKIEVRLIIDD